MQTKKIFHLCNTNYNTGIAVQDNAAQQWWYSTILAANTISNTGKFAKMVHPDFFGEDGGRSSHHSDLENQWLQVVDYDEDTGDQNGKPSTLPYPFPYTQRIIITSIAFCQPLSMHHLQSTFTKVKKENPQLGSNANHSGTVWQSYRYPNRLIVSRDYWYLWISHWQHHL